MTSRLRSILGGSNRVKKKTPNARPSSSRNNSSNSASPSPSSSWSNALPRTKPGVPLPSTKKSAQVRKLPTIDSYDNDDGGDAAAPTAPAAPAQGEEDFFHEVYSTGGPLPDEGLAHALVTDLTLRDVPQAMRYSRDKMFTPMPDPPSRLGLSSTRVAEVLNFRRNLPPLITTAHLHALLRSPTAVDRETAELVWAGTVRKVVVWRRGLVDPKGRGGGGGGGGLGGGVVEFLVEGTRLEDLVRTSGSLKDGEGEGEEKTSEAFLKWLRANPAKLKVSCAGDVSQAGSPGRLKPEQVDQLVRAGFLTTYHNFDIGHVSSGFARPEDRGTMLSLQSVSRAAAGSVEAVGGPGAVHSSGGSGVGGGGGHDIGTHSHDGGSGNDFSLAVPGQGAYLKLLSAAVAHLTSILAKSRYKEMPETLLRERWDGGVASESRKQHARRRERGDFAGVLAARTRKWKQFYGLAFEWCLYEAVGAGLMEVFETGSVGRGVRLLL